MSGENGFDRQAAIFDCALSAGDDLLVLGHRLSEWCGHAPILEEDIALANIALDCLGQASAFLALAGKIEGQERTADDLAFFRDEREFKNALLVEQPNGDFAATIARQFLFDSYFFLYLDELESSSVKELAEIAAKSKKETAYHLRHASEWVIRLGDGTEESKQRIQSAFDELWTFTAELFEPTDVELALIEQEKVYPDKRSLGEKWQSQVAEIFREANLSVPSDEQYMKRGGRAGLHTEQLGYLLSEMQLLARSHPGAEW